MNLIIVIIVLIVALVISLLRDSRSVADQPRGSSQINGGYLGDVYYHGSNKPLSVVKPYPIKSLQYKDAVFATNDYDVAVLFCAGYDLYYSLQTQHGCITYSIERFPGAFKIFDITGYVHHLPIDKFEPGPNLINEYVAYEPIKVIKRDKVNVRKYLEKSKIKLISFKQVLANLKKNTKINIVTPSNMEKIRTVYVMLDDTIKPAIPNVIYFNPHDPANLDNALHGEKGPVDLCGDLIDYSNLQMVEFPGAEIILLERKDRSNIRIPIDDYEKYIKARKKIYKGFKIEFYE